MAKYILVANGMEITEQALREIYCLHRSTTFKSERDYKAWKDDRIEKGIIKLAE